MTSITASKITIRQDTFKRQPAVLKILPGATCVDTTKTGEGTIDQDVAGNRTERVMATFHAALRSPWFRGYQ